MPDDGRPDGHDETFEAIARLPRRGGAHGTGRPILSAESNPPKDDTPMGLLTFAFFSFFVAGIIVAS